VVLVQGLSEQTVVLVQGLSEQTVVLVQGLTVVYVTQLTLIDFQEGQHTNLFITASSQAHGTNQPLVQKIREDFSPRIRVRRREADSSPLFGAEVTNPRSYTSTPHAFMICTESLPLLYTLQCRVSLSCNEPFLAEPLRSGFDCTDITCDVQ
jgi:hypothetical protein